MSYFPYLYVEELVDRGILSGIVPKELREELIQKMCEECMESESHERQKALGFPVSDW